MDRFSEAFTASAVAARKDEKSGGFGAWLSRFSGISRGAGDVTGLRWIALREAGAFLWSDRHLDCSTWLMRHWRLKGSVIERLSASW